MLFKGNDITSVEQAERVKLGIARTFQINRLFRGLSVLENVYMAIAERVGAAPDMFRPAGKRRDVIDEAMELLTRLKLADIAHKTIPELPYGRQRLVELAITLGLKPEVLLLDEPAAGVPSAESHIILDAIDALPKSIGVLIIDHDMDLVFRFAKKITVLVRGAVFAEGTPKEIGANPDVRAVYLGQATHGLARVELKDVSAGYGETVVLEDINLAHRAGRKHQRDRAKRRRQDHAAVDHHGPHHPAQGRGAARRARASTACRSIGAPRPGIGFVPQEREIFPSLSVLENLDVGARPGHWTKERVFELFPNLKERLDNRGNQLSGGEQQMLSIARALLTNPSVLLMDEPTEGLAPVIVETLTAVLIKLRSESGLSIILVEQNSRVAFEFSDRSVVLDKGRIVYDGASAALRDDPERLAKIIGVSE